MTDNNNINRDDDLPEITDTIVVRGKALAENVTPLQNKQEIIDAIKLVFDPEIEIDVYNLGLIYDISLKGNGDVNIIITLTSPTCPMADEIPIWVAEIIASLEGIGIVEVKIVWDPPWNLDKLTNEAKFQLDINNIDFNFDI